MGKEYEWKTESKSAIHVRKRWKYGFQYLDADKLAIDKPTYDKVNDTLRFHGVDADRNSFSINIGCEIMVEHLDLIIDLMAKRSEYVQYQASLPLCECCNRRKLDAVSHEYKNLHFCDSCNSTKSLEVLDSYVARKEAALAAIPA